MITVEKISAILQYKTNAKSNNLIARLAANAKTDEHALLGNDKKLKPKYETLANAMVALSNTGASSGDVIVRQKY